MKFQEDYGRESQRKCCQIISKVAYSVEKSWIQQAYAENIQKLGGVVNTAIVLGGAAAIIANKDRTLVDTLASVKDWAESLLSRMGFVKRKAMMKGNDSVKERL